MQATFRTQASALLHKNAVYQKRNRGTNCRIVVAPIFFCLILFLLQLAINSALNSADNKVSRGGRVGCKYTPVWAQIHIPVLSCVTRGTSRHLTALPMP